MKKFFSNKRNIIIVSLITIVVIGVIIGIIMLNNKQTKGSNNDNNQTDVQTKLNDDIYMVISINPRVMLKINNDVIIDVYQLNDDAIIFTNEELRNLDLEDGVKKIIKIATDNNYVKDDTVITLSLVEIEDSNYSKAVSYFENFQKTFIENGVHLKYDTIENKEEVNELKSIISNYQEKVKQTEDKGDNKQEDKNKNNTSNNSNKDNKENKPNNSTQNNTTNNSNSNSNQNTTSSNQQNNQSNNSSNNNGANNNSNTNNNNNATPTPTKLDVNNVYGSYQATAYAKIPWNNELGYSTPKAYYQAMIERCNNGTLSEVYPGVDTSYACNLVKRLNNNTYYDTYIIWYPGFIIGDYGIQINDFDFYGNGCEELYINYQGACGSGPNIQEVTITSDTEKYYIEFQYGTLGKVKCTAGKNLTFTCDKVLVKDTYSGKSITTFSKK